MGGSGSSPTIPLDATLEVFDTLGAQGTPLTATEVAAEVGCTRRTAHRKLNRLVDRGDLETKKTGASGRVWWRPISADGSGQTREIEQYKAAVDAARDGIVVLDTDGTFRLVNDAFAEGVGLAKDDLVGQPAATLPDRGLITEEVIDTGVSRAMSLLLGEAEQTQFEARIDSPVYGEMIVEANLSLLPPETDDQLVGGIVATIRPITERKRLEAELSETVAKLEESNQRLEHFAYIASHNLQEPIRMILNYLQLVDQRYADSLDDEGQEFVGFALDGAERMREMITDLLAYSRVDSQATNLETTDCGAVVDAVLRNLQVQIDEADAIIRVGSLPTIKADANQLEQVFQNLVSNALKYRDTDPLEIEIGAEPMGGEWVFRVADNGIGMDPDQTGQIFEVFQRLHPHGEYPGTGIGLAVCQRIIDRHEGRIWVDADPEEGSTFYFTIPRADGQHRLEEPRFERRPEHPDR